uniref:Uncharacterized protein n=1 Tax=Candidatus Kentrum sp. FW TaxID=2126338 RepID=A0A450U2D1_9GAMM|nr:MAG: hypothetical protein BECKFW1821C_GA0114237_111613 [Candidatus Kentron sp. FW]
MVSYPLDQGKSQDPLIPQSRCKQIKFASFVSFLATLEMTGSLGIMHIGLRQRLARIIYFPLIFAKSYVLQNTNFALLLLNLVGWGRSFARRFDAHGIWMGRRNCSIRSLYGRPTPECAG